MKNLGLLAISLLLSFGLLHALGYREDASILSGSPAVHPIGGALYVLAYFGAVVVVPIASLAFVLLLCLRRATLPRSLRARPPSSATLGR